MNSLVRRRRDADAGELAQDAAEGAIAGLVATGAMSVLAAVLLAAARRAGAREDRLLSASPEGDAPTEKLAGEMKAAVTRRRATRREKEVGGEVIHWTFGVVLGALYGLLAARSRRVSAGRGLAYGAAVFAGASEAALPILGLSLPPSSYAPAGHAMNLLTHLVYGATLDATTRGLRSAMG